LVAENLPRWPASHTANILATYSCDARLLAAAFPWARLSLLAASWWYGCSFRRP
jgi:hypothetical protein